MDELLSTEDAYDAMEQYLRDVHLPIQGNNLALVVADLRPGFWGDSSPLDPAAAGDWSAAVRSVTSRGVRAGGVGLDRSQEDWLLMVWRFLQSLIDVLGAIDVEELLSVIEDKYSVIDGTSISPWQLWKDQLSDESASS